MKAPVDVVLPEVAPLDMDLTYPEHPIKILDQKSRVTRRKTIKFLKVSPMKGVKRFGVTGKLSPRYIGPFPILEKCENAAYKLELPPSFAGVHDIFHVSQLKKCLKAPVDVVLPKVAPLDTDLTYPEHPIKILDQKSRVTRRKMIKFYKIQRSNHMEEEATWESEDFLRCRHPDFELP
jgi:hypothetical protein